jgi:hypothetical protein
MDQPALTADPNLENPPDFTTERFLEDRIALRPPGDADFDHEAAAATLLRQWNLGHTRRIAQWTQQLERQAEDQQRRQDADALRTTREQEELTKLLDEDKKKHGNKHVPLPNRQGPLRPPPNIAPTIAARMRKGLHCDLYHFTAAGMEAGAASKSVISQNPDAYLQVSTGEGSTMLLAPASSLADPSVKSIPDSELNFELFTTGATGLSEAMQRYGWPQERIDMVNAFHEAVLSHRYMSSAHQTRFSRRALLLYAAETRKAWHDAIEDNAVQAYRLEFNEHALQERRTEFLFESKTLELLSQVSIVVPAY